MCTEEEKPVTSGETQTESGTVNPDAKDATHGKAGETELQTDGTVDEDTSAESPVEVDAVPEIAKEQDETSVSASTPVADSREHSTDVTEAAEKQSGTDSGADEPDTDSSNVAGVIQGEGAPSEGTVENGDVEDDDKAGQSPSSSPREWMVQHKKPLRIMAGVAVLAAIVAAVIVGYVIPNSKYTQAQQLFESGQYDAAEELFSEIGHFKDAPDRLEDTHRHQTYEEAKQLQADGNNYEAGKAFAQVKELDDAADLACACADALVDAGKTQQAIEIYEALGEGYEDKISHAKVVQTMIEAEALIDEGSLQGASEKYANVPDDVSYNGKSAATRKQQLANALANLSASGTFNASKAHVQVTQIGSYGYSYWWESDDPWTASFKVTPSMDADGNVELHCSYSIWRYQNYSSINSALRTTEETGSFTCGTNPGSIKVNDDTTVSFSDGAWHVSYDMTDTSHDVYFDYHYTAEFTFTK